MNRVRSVLCGLGSLIIVRVAESPTSIFAPLVWTIFCRRTLGIVTQHVESKGEHMQRKESMSSSEHGSLSSSNHGDIQYPRWSAQVGRVAVLVSGFLILAARLPVAFADPGCCGCLDCNHNHIDDRCDVSCSDSGIACVNGQPLLVSCTSGWVLGCGASPDCNTNGTPDECDVSSGSSEDNNYNGIPDECDCAQPPCPSIPVSVPAGSTRPWEVGIPVSTYSTWNSRTGNLLTTIPIVAWSGLGPNMGIALYHNSGSVDASFNTNAGMGFDLGDGWTTSYSSQIILDDPEDPTDITVVRDDGTQDTYSKYGAVWFSQAGLHSWIEDATSTGLAACGTTGWRLHFKDQSIEEFGDYGTDGILLCSIIDATGQVLAITRDAIHGHRITAVADAVARPINFLYDANDRLQFIEDPDDPPGSTIFQDRSWELSHDVGDRLEAITSPLGFRNDITYDAENCINTISDRYDPPDPPEIATPHTYTYTYDTSHRLSTVTDPTPLAGGSALTQSFSIEEHHPSLDRTGTYTDRRGNDWTYDYASIGGGDGNLEAITDPLTNAQSFVFDSDRQLTSYKDALNKEWTYTYDSWGNQLTATDPLSHTQTWTYDTRSNVRTYTDADNNTVKFAYGETDVICSNTKEACSYCSASSSHPFSDCWDDYDCPGGYCVYTDIDCVGLFCSNDDDRPCTDDNDCIDTCSGGTCVISGQTCSIDDDCVNGTCGSTQGTCGLVGFPTLVSTITEPPDGQGNPEAITTMEYYDGSSSLGGMLRSVTDPNGVRTEFTYDQFGQPDDYIEGTDATSPPENEIHCKTLINSAGFTVWARCSPCGVTLPDAEGRVEELCCPVCNPNQCGGPPPGCGCARVEEPEYPSGWPTLPSAGTIVYLPGVSGSFHGAAYTPKNQLVSMPATVLVGATPNTRRTTAAYDELGRMTSLSIYSTERYSLRTRTFTYDYSAWGTGTFTRTGPDGVDTIVTYDAANRVTNIKRQNGTTVLMDTDYSYYDNGLVDVVSNSNGTTIDYDYDDAQRLTYIDHKDGGGVRMLRLHYTYTPNDLVASIVEANSSGGAGSQYFTYDDRGRLIHETRYDYLPFVDSYDIAYKYDQGGNRTRKIEQGGSFGETIQTFYTYDIDDPGTYLSKDNRLMKWEKWEYSGGGSQQAQSGGGPLVSAASPGGGGAAPAAPGGGGDLLEAAWYYYNEQGNPIYIVKRTPHPGATPDDYTATRFVYANNGRAVTFVVGESWHNAGNPDADFEATFVREFRYDGPRQRYLDRELDPDTLDPISETWSDYDGDMIYGDFDTLNGWGDTRSYAPGIGSFDWTSGAPDPTTVAYDHTNMIGTTRLTTDDSGDAVSSAKYRAFGDLVSGTPYRFGFAGDWGYQTDIASEFTQLHVGNRWYDPSIGRFIQRDPIGAQGGSNAYLYTSNRPGNLVDPLGLSPHGKFGGRGGHWPGPGGPWCPGCQKETYDVAKELIKVPKTLWHYFVMGCATTATVIYNIIKTLPNLPPGAPPVAAPAPPTPPQHSKSFYDDLLDFRDDLMDWAAHPYPI